MENIKAFSMLKLRSSITEKKPVISHYTYNLPLVKYDMNKKIELTLIILLIMIGNSFGQKNFRNGFIITLEHDTINGQVNYRSNSKNYKSCVFKSEQGETEYYPTQILGFGYIGDKYFTSQITQNSFCEVLVTGQISLYKSNDKFLVKKGTELYNLELITEPVEIDGKIGTKKNNRWIGLLTYLMSDCLENVNNLTPQINLDEKSLTRLLVAYNKCSGKAFTEYKASKPWTKFEFGASLGVTKSEILINNESPAFSYLDDSYRSVDPSIGLLIAISSPRMTERIAFQSEIHFIKSAYSSLVENGNSTEYHDTHIDLSTLSVPLSLKYSFPEKRCGWYLQGGINYEYHLNSDTRLLSEYVTSHVVNTAAERSAFEVNNNQIGYWGGIGILKSYRKFKGSISIRYFQMPAFNKTEGFSANNNRISFNLILFKK